MQKSMERPLALSLVVLGGLARIAQYMNFAPVGAVSLYSGARLRGWKAYLLPIALMAITDPLVGGYSATTPFVYASFLVSVWIGTRLRSTENPAWIGGAALIASMQFFLITNFGSWLAFPQTYGRTFAGLANCYVAAIPFFGRTLASDLVYSAALFGLHAWLSRTVVPAERVAVAA
jgi:uncharacterized protein DUF6580